MEGYLGVQDKAGEARVNSKIKIKIKKENKKKGVSLDVYIR